MSASGTALAQRSRTRPAGLRPADRSRLRPALFARFGDLTRLRYDFPLVLVPDREEGACVEPLAGLVDALLREIAPPGSAGERLRRDVLRLEREVRTAVSHQGGGELESLWDAAAQRLIAAGQAEAADLLRAREAMPLAGELVDCDATLPRRVVTHSWRRLYARRTREAVATIAGLEARLGGLVRADFLRSAAGRDPAQLRLGVGTAHQSLFDFETMARLLAPPSGGSALPDARRGRIANILDVLRTQTFFGDEHAGDFVFDSLEAALSAYSARLPEAADVVRAIAIAELETQGRFVEARHAGILDALDPTGLGPEELALLPDYLVCIDAGANDTTRAAVLPALASAAPLKVVVAFDDPFALGGRLAAAAMGLGNVFVLQTAASHLLTARERVRAALESRGPALLCVFTPPAVDDGHRAVPGYLVSAAAIESRAVPAFTYDPTAGPGWAERFSLHDNPQPERPWPRHRLTYADPSMQRVTEEVAFTAADLAVCDPRWARHFRRPTLEVPRDELVPIDAWLADGADGSPSSQPFVYALDAQQGTLERLIVDKRLAGLTRRSGEAWARLHELDGLKFDRLVAAPPAAVVPEQAEVATDVTTPALAETPVAPGLPEPVGDEPYIETPRCTTCNECTGINSRMFSYNENRQAFIADPGAGTYRELVEAAERCQVAIIHPGKPRNPNEPGLAELIERAAAFA